MERSQEINELTSIYTSLYKRDYYVKMEENTSNSSNNRIKVFPAVKIFYKPSNYIRSGTESFQLLFPFAA